MHDKDLQELDDQGILQLFGKAIDQSTILVWNGHYAPIRYVIYKMEQFRAERNEHGMTVILDVSTMEKNKFASYAAQLIPILQYNYPNTLMRMFVFPTTPLFTVVFKMAMYLVDPKTVHKISYEKTAKSLAQWITPDQYFQRFGGLAKDPFDVDVQPKDRIKKTAILAEQAGLEEIWVAPAEFHNI